MNFTNQDVPSFSNKLLSIRNEWVIYPSYFRENTGEHTTTMFLISLTINQLYGSKRFTVFPKDQEECLYPKLDAPWRSDLNVFEPD